MSVCNVFENTYPVLIFNFHVGLYLIMLKPNLFGWAWAMFQKAFPLSGHCLQFWFQILALPLAHWIILISGSQLSGGSIFSREKKKDTCLNNSCLRSLLVLTKFDPPLPQIVSYTWEEKRKEITILSAYPPVPGKHLCALPDSASHGPIKLVLLTLFNK